MKTRITTVEFIGGPLDGDRRYRDAPVADCLLFKTTAISPQTSRFRWLLFRFGLMTMRTVSVMAVYTLDPQTSSPDHAAYRYLCSTEENAKRIPQLYDTIEC